MKIIKSIVWVLILIILFFVANFFYRRFLLLGCLKETFFLQKEGTCWDQWAEKNGFGKTFQDQKISDDKTGQIKENYAITTLPATDITTNSATLNANIFNSANSVPPNGLSNFYYGSAKTNLSFSSDYYSFKVLGPYSVTLKDLKPKTTYYYTGSITFHSDNGEYSPESIKKSDIILNFTTL